MAEIYDFIIVGAGPAGCAIARRLAESPAQPSVLLVEAGGSNDETAHLSAAERFNIAFREGSPLNWFYKTQPQLKGQAIDYSRGKGLGGSTAINFCGWVVGADDDYNEWARLVGDTAFGWDNVNRCMKKVENFHDDVPAKFRKWFKPKSEDHGIGGAVDVSYQQEWLDLCDDLYTAAEQVGFGVNPDVNNGNPIGMGIGTVCVYDGVRVTSASAYLEGAPPNLTVKTGEHIEKVIFAGDAASGVQTINGRGFTARKDVIVSAGALNTPQVLMLSGIGPREHLEDHEIPLIQDLPEVGQNLQDHCMSWAGIVVKKEHDQTIRQSPTPMGWMKVTATLNSEEFKMLPSEMQKYLSRPHVPNWEFACLTPFFDGMSLEPNEEIFSGLCMLMNPQSRGTVLLRSADPRDAPLIDPKFLTHPFDRRNAIEAMREMLRYMQAPVWKRKTTRTLGWPKDDSDEAIWDTFSSNLRSSWHMCGTVRMGKDAASCTDTSFRVRGVGKLRVADMSVCPLVPNNHTQTTAYVIGEIAAEKLIAEHGLDMA
ncbi:glucose-methanol-choline oxidoreductase-like protein [Xylariaceae sp. FL0016]|nr:glucose-methanol-choline oxidoreductase-like protein [Xylariaceae sp. FL0016]